MKLPLLKTATGLILVGTILFGFNNCSKVDFDGRGQGLETFKSLETIVGNPFASKSLLSRMCTVITRCVSGVQISECENGILSAGGIDYQLGLAQGSMNTFSDILNAENAGSLVANTTALNACQQAVENLSCDNSSVQASYDSSSSTPFAKVALMIPTAPGSCPEVFNQPKARTEFYVSPTGSDFNDGSLQKPWASIAQAARGLVPGPEGAIVHVAPGTYTFAASNDCITPARPCSVVTHRSGTATAPITYISDQQWGAKIVASGANTAWYNSGDYVKIVGFEIVGSAETEFGVLTEGAYSEVNGNHIHSIPVSGNCGAGGSGSAGAIYFGFFAKTHDTAAIGNLIHDIGPTVANGLPDSSYCRFANGINIQQNGARIQNNIIYNIASSGIESWNNASNLQISNNLIFGTGHRSSTGFVGAAILLGSDAAVTMHQGSTVSNNILRNNQGYALQESNASSSNAYINNLVFSNGRDFQLTSGRAPVGTLSVDPQMVDFKASGGGNYRLLATSPAVNAGTLSCFGSSSACTSANDFAGFLRPYGMALDIGPYEWHP